MMKGITNFNKAMKPSRISQLILPATLAVAICSCASPNGGPGSPAAQAAARAEAQAFKDATAQAELNQPIKSGEFSLIITPDTEAAAANAIPVHVLSLNAAQVAQYKTMGADNYWKSPSAQAQSKVFGSSGSKSSTTLKVPSRDGADTLLIIAKLPPPTGGGDARIMEVPLKRTVPADPVKKTPQPPIHVRLSSLGLLPN